MADYVAISGLKEDRAIEFVDHLHEHFVDPVRIEGGRYLVPTKPGFSAEMKRESLHDHVFPSGPVWRTAARR
jgi:L-fuconate dehydratase